MRRMQWWKMTGIVGIGLFLAGSAGAISVAPGYTVTEISLSDVAGGDLVAIGGALFVGVGTPFLGGAQSVIRIDGSGTTVVADGFNGLAGFAYDAANDRLIVSDNAAEAPGAITGDTVYSIPSPLGAFGSPLAAAAIELLPSGSLPGVFDIALDPTDATGQTLFVSDATTFEVSTLDLLTGAGSVLQTTPGFTGGVATDGSTLFFGDVTFDANFVADGTLSSVPLPGTGSAATVATGLPGFFDVEVASDGSLLTTSGSELLRIDPVTGNVTTVASGFGFATGLFEDSGVIWALDGGFPGIPTLFQITPVPEPEGALLVGSGLLILLARARRGISR